MSSARADEAIAEANPGTIDGKIDGASIAGTSSVAVRIEGKIRGTKNRRMRNSRSGLLEQFHGRQQVRRNVSAPPPARKEDEGLWALQFRRITIVREAGSMIPIGIILSDCRAIQLNPASPLNPLPWHEVGLRPREIERALSIPVHRSIIIRP
jgi:hypothetical protein